jgi:hypothetical protein
MIYEINRVEISERVSSFLICKISMHALIAKYQYSDRMQHLIPYQYSHQLNRKVVSYDTKNLKFSSPAPFEIQL